MEFMSIDKLKPHPKNEFYFDNLSGEAWSSFLESIETSGIIEPVIVTADDLIIVSGHQRVRAARKLDIKEVAVELRHYDSEDEILKQLIETNICQRGVGNPNAIKFGRCIKELERIYGIKQGNNQHAEVSTNGGVLKTQEELLAELGMNKETYRRYKKVAELPEEIQQMVMDGKVTASSASRIIATMSPEEQAKFAEEFADKKKVTSKDIEFYKKRIQEQQKEIHDLRENQNEPKVVPPADYEQIKSENESLRSDYEFAVKERQKYLDKMNEANKRIKELETRDKIDDAQKKLEIETEYLSVQINSFIRTMGGYIWITEKIDEVPEKKRLDAIKAIKNINAWSQQMLANIGGNII